MKNLFFVCFCLACSSLIAQDKHDYIWLLGYAPSPGFPNPILGGSKINFHYNPAEISYFDIPFDFTAIAMISNSMGALQFYTNGCQIINRDHELMPNGDSIIAS